MLPLRLSSILDLDAMRDDARALLAQKYPAEDVVSALARRVDDYLTWDWVVDVIDAPAGSPGAAASAFAAVVLETLDGPVLELVIRRLVRRVQRTMDEGDNDSPKKRALALLRDSLRLGRLRPTVDLRARFAGSRSGDGSRSLPPWTTRGSGDAQLDERLRSEGPAGAPTPASGGVGA